MKARIKKAALLVIAATFLLTSALYAYHGDKKCSNFDREEKFEKLSTELGLTAEQKAQLKEQRETFKDKQGELMTKSRAKNKELGEELEKPEVDRAKVNKIISDIQTLTGEKLRNRVEKIIAMKGMLTPEQFKKLQDKMERKRCEVKDKDMQRHRSKRR